MNLSLCRRLNFLSCLLTLTLTLTLIFLISVPASQAQEKPLDAAGLYDAGMELYYQGKYEASLETFSRLIRSFPTSQSVPYSQYMIARCYLQMERLEESIREFERYLKMYPDGYRARDAEKGIQFAKEKLEKEVSLPPPPATFYDPFPPTAPRPSTPASKPGLRAAEQVKKVKRRVCAQVFSLEAKTFEEIEKSLKDLKKAGVNTLIVRVFQNEGDRMYKFATPRHNEGVYFKTNHAPVVDDILGKWIDICHRNGLDIFAWITTRYADFGSDGNSDHRCMTYNFETRKMEIGKGITLFHPEVLKRLEGLFRDLGRYPLDGILFQDDLILKHNEDFSVDAVRAFLKEFGYSPHPDLFYIDPYKSETGKYYVKAYTDRFWVWVNWKNRWLMNVAQRLMAAARESNPKLQFAINLYYEAVLNPLNGVAWFSQSLSEALAKDFDYYAVMAYHRQTMRELKMEDTHVVRLMAEVAQKAVASVGDPSRVMMKLQVLDWSSYEVLAREEVEAILNPILGSGHVSLAFVPYLEQFPFHLLKKTWDPSPDPHSKNK